MSDDAASPASKRWYQRLWARKWVKVLLIALAVLAPLGGAAGAYGWKYIKTDPQFCMSCHLMVEPAEKWKLSAHKDIACQTCHRADIFEEARLGYAAFIQQKKEIPPHAEVPVAICAECHVSNNPKWKQIAATPGHRVHFAQKDIACLRCHATKVHEFQADTEKCIKCHGETQLALKKMDTLHCLGCHDFLGKHGNAELRPDAKTCRECHAAEKDAVVAGATKAEPGLDPGVAHAEGVRLVATAAPVWKGHENCLGCHRPHGAPLKDPTDCLACHTKLLEADNKHYKDERLTSCLDCHEPHGGKL
jgi:nitrate/TMAO reductase-like tetraheme cytochrome c subunit